jgi:hypothetical protein
MNEWTEVANVVYDETKNALQVVYSALNQGQQKKLLKDAGVKELFDRYGVEYTE